MAEIEAWLDAEESIYQAAQKTWEESESFASDEPVRGFRCNWDSVKRGWRSENAQVYVLLVDGRAVGFLDGYDIMEIRPDLRGVGYGRILAEFMLGIAAQEGRSVVEIEIAPSTAEPFWKHMGFTTVPERLSNGTGIYAYKILPQVFSLSGGDRAPFSVEFFTEEEKYSATPKPFARFSGIGERLSGDQVQLPQRVYCFNPADSGYHDYFVRIEVGGCQVQFEKVKRASSRACGIERDAGDIYFMDRITVA
ncbi:GNAT family N-acetyltransferase [Mesorhizobium sp. BR115XR7A]|uniref:GNAT family N-acetyltransferase n=1 Tax=Mesorhizobium sp. BR115XR7A TaxID=2876645 RepID=UPI001CCFD28C|nr:GNAT family N-acetyltransferase [Mesorhizobium sp. BR115XR7A]MBZ9908084.1 GNAT family N-acetyltransferase [Mesorhizobium sp. BR115XR7A]MBZ9930982.1 GNAT family N-acetyltransferase [Mesorhizobium sp. BR1-1-5]